MSFLSNFVPKSKKLLLIIHEASITNYRCHTTKCSYPKKLVWKSFLDTILQTRSLCHVCDSIRSKLICHAHIISKDGIKRIRGGIRIRYLYARKIRQILRIAAFLWRMETIANFLKRFPSDLNNFSYNDKFTRYSRIACIKIP